MIITGGARLAGVMGWPVTHSLSPVLHGYWLEQFTLDGAYVPLAVEPANFETALSALAKLGFRGVNVTLPHKETAFRAVDRLDSAAQRIGAVNTITVAPDGSFDGSNTDAFGFHENLVQGAPGRWSFESGPAVVLGAGGAARAVVVALIDAEVPEIRLVNRTRERAEALIADLSDADPVAGAGCLSVDDWSRRAQVLEGANLLVNTTTLGMMGKEPLNLDLTALPVDALVNDIVYAPLVTSLLAQARDRGNPWIDGLGMLLHQARPGFRTWFGREPEVTDALRDRVLAKLVGG